MAALDDLLDYIFDHTKTELYAEFETWMRGSRRFKAFAQEHRDKIRSKLRNVRDDAGMKDLRAELETAVLLLREERFTLEYEMYAASKQRGPDFTVTFKTHTPFNVEVRRIRMEDDQARVDKLMTVLCDKVRQMPPSIMNLLWLNAEETLLEADLTRAVANLRQLAERGAESDAYFARRGFENAGEFLKYFQRLSGIVRRQPGGLTVWLNPIARHKMQPEIVTAIQRLEAV